MIVEYEEKYAEDVKELLVELQNYIIEIDKYNLNIITDEYRNLYFENMLTDIENNNGKLFISLNDNKVCGFIAGFVEQYNELDKCQYKCPKKGIVAELIVSKDMRTNGQGKMLLQAMEEYFKSIGCEYSQIDVFAYNENAIKFYSKNDYENRMVTMFKKL